MSSGATERTGQEPARSEEGRLQAALDRGAALDILETALMERLERDPGSCAEAATELRYLRLERIDTNAVLRELQDDTPRRSANACLVAKLVEVQQRNRELEDALARAQLPRQRKPRHAGQPPLMRLVDGARGTIGKGMAALIPAAGGLAALGRSGHAHLAGHHALAVKLTAASLVLSGSGLAVGAAVVIGHAQSHHAARVRAGTVTGSTPPDMAVRIPLGQQKLIAAVTRPEPKPKHGRAAPAAVSSSLLPSLPLPSATVTAGPSQQPGQPSPSASQGPQAGVLSVPVTSVQADPATGASIILDASADGAVPWGMTCTAAADSASPCSAVAFSAMHGAIAAGGSGDVVLTFSAAAQAAGGDITLRFAAPGKRIDVTVTWLPVPQPAVTATPAGTGTPSPDPSPTVPVAS